MGLKKQFEALMAEDGIGIAFSALPDLIQSIWISLLSVSAVIAACILVAPSILEFFARRLAEHQKGPVMGLGPLVAGAISFLKVFA
jgi:hypothetical protein